jgi:outer membrane murein-binding lipoprotein Lpp
MNRFLMLVGVAVVAAAMYVAAGTASQQSRGPTAKQFKALKTQVATLGKKLKATKAEADAAVGFLAECLVSTNAGVWGVSEFGDGSATPTFGYEYTPDNKVTVQLATALDFDGSTTPDTYLQAVDPACVNTTPLRHLLKPGSARLPLASESSRSH